MTYAQISDTNYGYANAAFRYCYLHVLCNLKNTLLLLGFVIARLSLTV